MVWLLSVECLLGILEEYSAVSSSAEVASPSSLPILTDPYLRELLEEYVEVWSSPEVASPSPSLLLTAPDSAVFLKLLQSSWTVRLSKEPLSESLVAVT